MLNPARQPNGLAYDEYMRRAFDDLDRATVIVLLDGWSQSKARPKNSSAPINAGSGFCIGIRSKPSLHANLKKKTH